MFLSSEIDWTKCIFIYEACKLCRPIKILISVRRNDKRVIWMFSCAKKNTHHFLYTLICSSTSKKYLNVLLSKIFRQSCLHCRNWYARRRTDFYIFLLGMHLFLPGSAHYLIYPRPTFAGEKTSLWVSAFPLTFYSHVYVPQDITAICCILFIMKSGISILQIINAYIVNQT